MPPETPDTQPQAGSEQQTPAPAAGGENETSEAKITRLEKELKDTRSESAGYRTRLRGQEQAQQDAERAAAVEQGKFKDLYEAELKKRSDLEAESAKTARTQALAQAASAAKLPADMASRLVGDTPEELAADAQRLAQLLRPEAPDTGSTNPSSQRRAGELSENEQIDQLFSKKPRRSGIKF